MAKPKYDVGYLTRLPIERCTHPDDQPITASKVCAVLAYRRHWNETRECWETVPPLTEPQIQEAERVRKIEQRRFRRRFKQYEPEARRRAGLKVKA